VGLYDRVLDDESRGWGPDVGGSLCIIDDGAQAGTGRLKGVVYYGSSPDCYPAGAPELTASEGVPILEPRLS